MNRKDRNMFELTAEVAKIGNRAVHKAQEENRKLGIPNVYAKRGQIYYQLPDGRITAKKENTDLNVLCEETTVYRKGKIEEEGD